MPLAIGDKLTAPDGSTFEVVGQGAVVAKERRRDYPANTEVVTVALVRGGAR